jgi:hypothetical protein
MVEETLKRLPPPSLEHGGPEFFEFLAIKFDKQT